MGDVKAAAAAARAWIGQTDISTVQQIFPSTTQAYDDFVAAKRLERRQSSLKDGGTLLWLGDITADRILLYFHGGGYVTPAVPAHFEFLWQSVTRGVRSGTGPGIAVAILAYDLAPRLQYPGQLKQALSAYNYLTTRSTALKQKIILGGDSAGANLALGLILHLEQTLTAPSYSDLTKPFAGVLLVSPWVTTSTTSSSFERNRESDCINAEALSMFTTAFLGSAEIDIYNNPIMAPSTYWRSLSKTRVLITAGADELFVDDVEKFVGILRKEGVSTDYIRAECEVHDSPIFNLMQCLPESRVSKEISTWLDEIS